MAACHQIHTISRTLNYWNHYGMFMLVVVLGILSHTCVVNGVNDPNSNSHMSPKSDHYLDDIQENIIKSSSQPIENIIFESTPRIVIDNEASLDLSETTVITPTESLNEELLLSSSKSNDHVIVVRSASPILSGDEEILLKDTIKNNLNDQIGANRNDDLNNIEKYLHLSPTQSYKTLLSTNSGEVLRAPHGKALSLLEPNTPNTQKSVTEVVMVTTPKDTVSETSRGRQSNPDIQDIITGIVKLLNGNVNVQANTAPPLSRPHRPLSTRINNRGPPRISDLPPLPTDFENPSDPSTPSSNVLPPPPTGQMTAPSPSPNTLPPTKIPPPYPFDLPHPNTPPIRPFINGVPVPEQIVPLGGHRPNGNGRPHGNRPPWHRPRPRPPQRLPPNIPPYKPMPPMDLGDEISLTSVEPANIENIMSGGEHNQHIPITENQEPIMNSNIGQTEATYHDLGDQLTFHDFNLDSNDTAVSITEINLESSSANPIELTSNKNEYIKESYPEKKPTIKDKEKPSLNKTDKIVDTEEEVLTLDSNSTQIPTLFEETVDNVNIQPTVTSTEIRISTMDITTSSIINENLEHIPEIEGIGEAIPILETSMKEIESIVSKIDATASTNSTSSSIHQQPTPTEGLPSFTSTQVLTDSSMKSTEIISTTSEVNIINNQPTVTQSNSGFPYYPYRPRPGIVLDDTDFKPGGHRRPPILTRPPLGGVGEIFDITVSAIQGPGGAQQTGGQGKPYVIPVDIDGVHIMPTNADVITSPSGSEGFVSIDGKRTYLNLFGDESTSTPTTSRIETHIKPTKTVSDSTVQITGTGYAIPQTDIVQPGVPNRPGLPSKGVPTRRPVFSKRPLPPVRIDTCIVGDDSTCDAGQQEMCRTEMGVSSCHCRPGYSRRKHREPCRRVVAILVSLRVDKMYERRIVWDSKLANKDTDEYRQLAYEATRAIDSAMSMTPFSDDFLEAKVNNVFKGDPAAGTAGVFVNITMHLEEDSETVRPQVKADIHRHLLGVIQRRSNNIGSSALWVDGPAGAVSALHDLDECSHPDLNDCHAEATCTNVFGSFKCQCKNGFRDPWADNRARAGRKCETCPTSHCNNRGQCKYEKGQQVCVCQGNYYGSQCEVDGEVVTVAVGASVAAIIIIGLTLVCLVMWSRKWNREQKAAAAAVGGLGGLGSPVFGYMAAGTGGTVKTPAVGPPPYQLTLEDRMRWAHLADVMAQANHYAPDPVGPGGITRPSSAVFGGYPTLSLHGTIAPPVPLPRLGLHMSSQQQQRSASIHGTNLRSNQQSADNTSSSEEEDRTDLLGRNFHVPRPKSRSSVANQSGIYYDVDYDQGEIYKHANGGGIPMSTYTPGRPPYFRN